MSSRRAASAFLVPVFLLLADGPGAGKAIRPGLLLKEPKMHGDIKHRRPI